MLKSGSEVEEVPVEVGYGRKMMRVVGYGRSMAMGYGRLVGVEEGEMEEEGAERSWAEADKWMRGRRERG